MKAVILAAGCGSRMGKYAESLPKGMLVFNGKTLIEWQIEKFKSIGLKDIIVITGYKKDAINYPGVVYYHNPDYAETNMIETLMCARDVLNTDVLISYSDIFYTQTLARMTMEHSADIAVAVDEAWRDYWKLRYGTVEHDLETLAISEDGRIRELGKPVNSSEGINHRYIGLVKFSRKAMVEAIKLYDNKRVLSEAWKQSGNPFRNGYMTDLLSELIQKNVDVRAVVSHGGWLEFDTSSVYEKSIQLAKRMLDASGDFGTQKE